jgi:dolichol-phosphate mannosyltransferase
MRRISVVVPVFNEEEIIGLFYDRTSKVLDGLEAFEWEILFVDDGCKDGSFEKLSALAARDPRVKVLKFSRNFGHQIAITAGVDEARGDCVVVIDSDLQDPPEVIPAMVAEWRTGVDVVYGVRSEREGETAMKLMTASMFYRLLGRVTNVQIPANVGVFRLRRGRVVVPRERLREEERVVRGRGGGLGVRQTGVA